jgi:hypothetical protein
VESPKNVQTPYHREDEDEVDYSSTTSEEEQSASHSDQDDLNLPGQTTDEVPIPVETPVVSLANPHIPATGEGSSSSTTKIQNPKKRKADLFAKRATSKPKK